MKLEIGDAVRYRGIGAGIVKEHVKRKFKSQTKTFAVIEFPHQDMQAQLPLEDEKTIRKLSHIISPEKAKNLLKKMNEPKMVLSRTWDQREEAGEKIVKKGQPEDWVDLLAAYAFARGQKGLAVSSSDQELVREAVELVAAEITYALGKEYNKTYKEVRDIYDKAFQEHRQYALDNGLIEED